MVANTAATVFVGGVIPNTVNDSDNYLTRNLSQLNTHNTNAEVWFGSNGAQVSDGRPRNATTANIDS